MPDNLSPDEHDQLVKIVAAMQHFKGQWMTCKKCGAKEKSHLDKMSNWSFIQVDNGGFYVCNGCYNQETLQELLRDHLKQSENG